jgi:hypothetical protein
MPAHADADKVPLPPKALASRWVDDEIHLSWAPPEDPFAYGLTQYNVYRNSADGLSGILRLVATVTPTDNPSYVDADVTRTGAYVYFVQAENVHGAGAPSLPTMRAAWPDCDPITLSPIPPAHELRPECLVP